MRVLSVIERKARHQQIVQGSKVLADGYLTDNQREAVGEGCHKADLGSHSDRPKWLRIQIGRSLEASYGIQGTEHWIILDDLKDLIGDLLACPRQAMTSRKSDEM